MRGMGADWARPIALALWPRCVRGNPQSARESISAPRARTDYLGAGTHAPAHTGRLVPPRVALGADSLPSPPSHALDISPSPSPHLFHLDRRSCAIGASPPR
ncbi:hypothetical protein C8F04DRAFT_1100888 [Mycena alexandri]|uniref:Uncharacterized protein n=1 Tax=Mycena alexandri TaxID=1745969 RepID=A0AAD6X4L8_9AGAR|nr:hypothetical protein C8F04DRAFT_1100752 [Mycena alexandri]KAJ7034733.1 hypothetical protein C8F04DRAFT_1100854 [Mycena alexandri]KAJ7034738.1 hypothetical protein C8F04DRAFT_1100888 [Mycena alexandri]